MFSTLADVVSALLINVLTIDFGKLFHEANLLMILISDCNLFGEHILEARVTRLLIQEIRCDQGT